MRPSLASALVLVGCAAPAAQGPARPSAAPEQPSSSTTPTHSSGPTRSVHAAAAHPGNATPRAHADAEHQQHGAPVHRFDNAERWAQRFDDPARDAWQKPEHVVALLQLEPGMTVADLGAGTGYFLRHLSLRIGSQGKVWGLDVEPDMVRYMQERAQREGLTNVEARQVDAADPRLPPSSLDRILVVDTWHHIAQRERYASKLAAALEPRGRVVIVDFTLQTHRGPPKEHRVPPDQVVRELQAAGLTARILDEELPDQYVVVGEKPQP